MANPYVLGAAAFPYEEMPFHSQTYSGMEDGFGDSPLTYIDPTLQSPSPALYGSPWEPPVHRFPKSTGTALVSGDIPMHMASRAHMRSALVVHPGPSPSQIRFPSPLPSSEPPSSSGSAHSPCPESEPYYENFPRTPPDTNMFSPYQAPAPLEPFSSAHAVQFTSMGPSLGSDCVNPLDVNPNQQADYCESDNGLIDFSLAQTRYSYDSHAASHCDAEPAQAAVVHDFDTAKRMASPEEMRSMTEADVYPPLPRVRDDSLERILPPKDDAAVPRSKRPSEDNGDEDYRPSKKPKPNTRTTPQPAAKSRPKAAAPPVGGSVGQSPRSGRRRNTRSNQLPPTASASTLRAPAVLTCRDCSKNDFEDQTELDMHIKKHHTRPFNCVFDFAGCDSSFATKNEWKRHVSSQHLLLNYWVCTECEGSKPSSSSSGSSSSSSSSSRSSRQKFSSSSSAENSGNPNGAIFNRKDLFTQHLKRMHAPAAIKHLVNNPPNPPPRKQKTPQQPHPQTEESEETTRLLAQWNTRLRALQESCKRDRCRLPKYMACPVLGCDHAGRTGFRGDDAWNQRMEHVARHMERAAAGLEARVVFGDVRGDPTLVRWAADPAVAIIVPSRRGRRGHPSQGRRGLGLGLDGDEDDGEGDGQGQGQMWELKSPLQRKPGGNVVVLAPVLEEEEVEEEEEEVEEEEEEADDGVVVGETVFVADADADAEEVGEGSEEDAEGEDD